MLGVESCRLEQRLEQQMVKKHLRKPPQRKRTHNPWLRLVRLLIAAMMVFLGAAVEAAPLQPGAGCERSWRQQGPKSVVMNAQAELPSNLMEVGKATASDSPIPKKQAGTRQVAVDTVNGTTGKASYDYLCSKLCTAEAACVQELGVAGDGARALENAFLAGGWKVKANDSEVTQGVVKKGFSAGIAVGARKSSGVCQVDGLVDGVVVEHRASLIHWNGLVKGGVDLGSVYLVSGDGPSRRLTLIYWRIWVTSLWLSTGRSCLVVTST